MDGRTLARSLGWSDRQSFVLCVFAGRLVSLFAVEGGKAACLVDKRRAIKKKLCPSVGPRPSAEAIQGNVSDDSVLVMLRPRGKNRIGRDGLELSPVVAWSSLFQLS